MTVCRRSFLEAHGFRFVPGLKSEDAEFSPRVLYRAERVAPLHLPFYNYRTQRRGSIMTSGNRASLPKRLLLPLLALARAGWHAPAIFFFRKIYYPLTERHSAKNR